MAIYRPPRSPWRARILMAGAGLLIGGLIVWLLAPEGEPPPAERAARARSELVAAEAALEIVAIEYSESVQDGEVVAQAEYEGALAALDRSRSRYESVRDMVAEAGGPTTEIDASYDQVASLMERRVPNERLVQALDDLGALLTEGVFR